MLNMIKNLINEKTSFLEEANIIFEDTTIGQIDDAIVLGEEDSDNSISDEENENEFEIKDEDDSTEGDSEPEEDESENDDDTDIMDTPVENEPDENHTDDSDDIANQPIDDQSIDNMNPPQPTNDGTDTNDIESDPSEPVNDNIDDILNVEIDLKSNTMNDVLPVPPANANEAVPNEDDDILNTRIDAGFEDDFTEATKTKSDTFSIYGIEFKIPEVSGFISRYETKALTPSFKKKVRTNVINALSNPKNIKQIENDILYDEQQIGEKDDTDEIRVKRIKDYLSKSKSKVLLCTTKGNAAIHIDIPYTSGICAWLEHELWITVCDDKVNAGSYDDVTFIESSGAKDNSDNQFTEAITLGGDDTSVDASADTSTSTDATSDPAAATDTPADATAPAENDVTAAVRDKVAEADAPVPTETSGDNQSTSKDELLKKLGNITKSLEDAKKAIMNSIQ